MLNGYSKPVLIPVHADPPVCLVVRLALKLLCTRHPAAFHRKPIYLCTKSETQTAPFKNIP